jgi:cation:H+ antiporter
MAIQLLAGLLIILIGAELFTNAIEWLGFRLGLSEGTVGNLLAAVGTALPESIVPLVAFLTGNPESMHIGIGAILGAPFMLGTLAMFVTGFAAWLLKGRCSGQKNMQVEAERICIDLRYFMIMYLIALSAAFLPQWCRPVAVIILFLGYLFYGWTALHTGQALSGEGLHPLYFSRQSRPSFFLIILQLVLGLGAIAGGARYFVNGIEYAAHLYGIHPLVLSMIIAPLATELPEKFNSVIWVAHGKDRLALGNITGAMVFQSTMIPAMGILLSEWRFNLAACLSSGILLCTVGGLYGAIRKRKCVSIRALICCGIGYLFFLMAILWSILS